MKNNANAKPSAEVDGAILGVLTEHRRGEVISDLSQALREVTEAVQLVGKAGYVTLKLKVACAQGTSNTLVISDEVKLTLPKAERQGSIFYADHNNNLVREDPDQTTLPLALVDVTKYGAGKKPVVDVVETVK